jgi:hypothetical protein
VDADVHAPGSPELIFRHLSEVTAIDQRRILAEITQAVTVANLKRAPRLTAVRDELDGARGEVSDNGKLPAFSDEAQIYLEAINPRYRELPTNELLAVIDAATSGVEADVKSAGQHKGGRHSDGRVRHFVNILAVIYETETGMRPTHTVDPASGESTSPFNRFVLECFRQFWPGDVQQAAVREAMRLTLLSRLEEPGLEMS